MGQLEGYKIMHRSGATVKIWYVYRNSGVDVAKMTGSNGMSAYPQS